MKSLLGNLKWLTTWGFDAWNIYDQCLTVCNWVGMHQHLLAILSAVILCSYCIQGTPPTHLVR